MTKYHQPLTAHHKLCQTWWGNSLPQNIVMLREKVHQAVHTVFQDDTPVQRIRRTIEADKLTYPDVYDAVDNVLKRFEWVMNEVRVYDPRILDSDKFIKKYANRNTW